MKHFLTTDTPARAWVAFAVGVVAILAFSTWALSAPQRGESYECKEIKGCPAFRSYPDGRRERIVARKGDRLCTAAGWQISTDDGWEKLVPKRPPKKGD